MGTAEQLRLAPISLKNILFAMDFSPGSLRAYPFAAGIAYRYGGKVLVAHVLPPEESTSLPQAERAYLDKLLQTAAEAGLHDPKGRLPDIPHEVFFDHGDICARLCGHRPADDCQSGEFFHLFTIAAAAYLYGPGSPGWHTPACGGNASPALPEA